MRIILIVLGILVAMAAAVYAIGMTLPQDHVASRTTHLSAPPETVWSLISDYARYPEWRKDVTSVEKVESGGAPTWREVSGSDRMTYEAVVWEAPTHLIAQIADKGLPFGGSWDYRLEPDGAGTRITIRENGEVYNPLFRFVSKYIMGHTATIDKYLKSLSARLGDTYDPGSA
ncbi:MAG: SRPBCC family protein [Gemmatimonadales bacterium]